MMFERSGEKKNAHAQENSHSGKQTKQGPALYRLRSVTLINTF
jgi:hypothetical protein